MRLSPPLRMSITFLAAAAIYGCAQSEPWDISILQPDGGGASGGMTGSGTGGDSSSSGGTPGKGTGGAAADGTGGSVGSGGDIGTGGMTTGSGGFTGSGGIEGTGGTGSGSGGSTGTGGIKGTGGVTGSGGRGGTVGTGGSSAKGGAAGTGGLTGSGGVSGTGGAAAPTFTQVYTQILVVYCAGSKCHNPGAQSNISFATQASAYSSLQKLVVPGNGAGSSFYKTVNSGAMPQGQAKLSAANLALIEAWIDAGALNN